MARPTKYNKALGDRICERLAAGESLNRICKDAGYPNKSNVFKWLLSDSEVYKPFQDNYAKAREIQYQNMADEILDIADDGTNDYVAVESDEESQAAYRVNGENIQRSRLRVDTRKWFMSKVLPKFSDKQIIDHQSSDRSMTPVITAINPIEAAKQYQDLMKGSE